MAISANKVAPSAVVIAFVGYCIWPSVSEFIAAPPPAKAAQKVVELAPSLLKPSLPPCPTKNPWGGRDAASLAAAREAAKKASKTSGASAGAAAKSVAPANPLEGLKLDATCILGEQRQAIINGHVYKVKDAISPAVATAPPCIIKEILPHKVMLEYQSKPWQLTYSNVASGEKSKSPTNASANESKIKGASAASKPRTNNKAN